VERKIGPSSVAAQAHARIADAKFVTEAGEGVVIGDRRKQHYAEQGLPLEEIANFVEHRRGAADDRADDEFKVGSCSAPNMPC
jgi:hypothetical protein